MKKNLKGNESNKRPISIRALALFMAVVMVISVITVTNRRDKVKAEATEYSTESPSSVARYIASDATIYSPAKGVKITLNGDAVVIDDEGEDGEYSRVFKKTNDEVSGDAFVVADSCPEGYEGYPLDVNIKKNTKWFDSDGEIERKAYDGSDTGTKFYFVTAEETDVTVRLKEITSYEFSGDNYEGLPGDIQTAINKEEEEVKATLIIKTYKLSDIDLVVDEANKQLTLSDPDASHEYDAGVAIYNVYKDDNLIAKDVNSVEEVNTALNGKGTEADGTYKVEKVVCIDGNPDRIISGFSGEDEKSRNFYVLKSFEAGADGGEMVTGNMTDPSAYSVTVPASGKANPKRKIIINYELDAATTDVTVDPSDVSGTAVDIDTANNKITIPGALSNNGEDKTYTVTIKQKDSNNNEAVDNFKVNINYGDGTPTVSINNDNPDIVTEADDPYTISATVGLADEDSGAEIEDADVLKLDNPTDTDPEELGSAIINQSTASKEVDLTPGNNYFKMQVTSDFGLHADSELLTVFLDDQAPAIESIKLSQPTLTWNGGTASKTDNKYTVSNMVSCKDKTVIEVKVSDLQSDSTDGSGINTVTIGGTEASYNSATGIATLEIAATDYNNDTDKSWDVEVLDKAGHETDALLNFSFFDDTVEIDIDDNGETPEKRTSEDFYIWDDPDQPAASIRVKIKSEVEITQVEIDDTVGKNTVSFVEGQPEGGKHVYTATYNFNVSYSKDKYKITVDATNKNVAKGSKVVADVRSIDITKPDDITNADITVNPNVSGDDWAPKVILIVKVTDPGVTSGIKEVKATGTTKDVYNLTDGQFEAQVKPSQTTAGTDVTFKVYDNAGNYNNEWSGNFKVDPDVPKVDLSVDGVEYNKVADYLDKDPVITYSVSDVLSGLAVTDGKTLAINGTTYDFDTSNGKALSKIVGKLDETKTYTIVVSGKDKAGNTKSVSCSFKVDGSKPVLTNEIVTQSVKGNNYYNKGVEIKLTVKDSNILKKDIKVQDANGKTITLSWSYSDGLWSATYIIKDEGKYTVKLSAEDRSGNKDSKSISFVIDKTNPVLTAQIDGKTYNGKSTFFKKNTQTSVVVKDAYEDKSDVSVKITRSPFNGGKDEEITKTGKGPFTLSKDGKYSITYMATDLAGNTKTKTIGLLLDKTKPLTNMYIKTAKPAKFKQYNNTYNNKTGKFTARSDQENYKYGQYYNTDVEIEFNYFEYNPDEIIVYDYNSADGVETEIEPSWKEGKTGYGKASVTISDEGYHKIRIEVIDEAENTCADKTAEKTLRFTVDKTAPSIVTAVNGSGYSSGSGIRYLSGGGTVGVSVSDTNKDPDDLTRTLKITAPGGGTSTSVEKISEGTESFNTDADYEINYEAVDKAGNKSGLHVVQFRVDKQPPELSITSNASAGTSTTDVTVTFTIKEPFYSDVTSSSIEVYKRVDGTGESHVETISFMPRSGSDSMSKTYTEEGEYRFVFTAEDKTGNKANTDYSFILDGNKPVITLSGVSNYDKTDKNVEFGVQVNEKFYLTNNVIISGTRTDIDGNKTNIDFAEFPAHSGPVAALQQLFKEDGIYDITVKSTDKAGNSDQKSIHFTIDTEAPVIKNLSDYDGTTVNAFLWDNDLEKTIRDLTVCNVKVYMDGVEYDGVTDLSDGAHTLRVEAVDELGNQTVEEYTFVLDTIEPIIIVNGVEDGARLKESTEVSVTVQLDEDLLDYVKVDGKAVAVTDNKCNYTVDSRGKYTLEAGASDAAGNKTSIKYDYVYGTGINWIIVGIAAGILILLALIILLLKRRNANS